MPSAALSDNSWRAYRLPCISPQRDRAYAHRRVHRKSSEILALQRRNGTKAKFLRRS